MDRAAIKKQLHAARVSLDYQMKTDRPARGARTEAIAKARARVDELAKLYEDCAPFEPTLIVRNDNFIGPKRKRGARGDGPTIVCFRCEHEKPRDEFYTRGTVCKACYVKRAGEWAGKNPEKVNESREKWASENKVSVREKGRARYKQNATEERLRSRKYRQENKPKINKLQREYLRRRKSLDPKFRALNTCKRRMWILFKSVGRKKTLRSKELLGIDRAGFFAHIESLFKPGMTWNNRGKYGWHIDHKKPCALFDMTDPEQAKACWNYKNLQPLWCHENWAKGDNYVEPKDIDGDKKSSVCEVATVEQSAVSI